MNGGKKRRCRFLRSHLGYCSEPQLDLQDAASGDSQQISAWSDFCNPPLGHITRSLILGEIPEQEGGSLCCCRG